MLLTLRLYCDISPKVIRAWFNHLLNPGSDAAVDGGVIFRIHTLIGRCNNRFSCPFLAFHLASLIYSAATLHAQLCVPPSTYTHVCALRIVECRRCKLVYSVVCTHAILYGIV
jgi:hypothetical protein